MKQITLLFIFLLTTTLSFGQTLADKANTETKASFEDRPEIREGTVTDGECYLWAPETVKIRFDRGYAGSFSIGSWSGDNFYPDWEDCTLYWEGGYLNEVEMSIEHYPEGEYDNGIIKVYFDLNVNPHALIQLWITQNKSGLTKYVRIENGY